MGEVIIKGGMIEGVVIQPLQQIRDARGMVMHMLRSDSVLFERFGEIYFSVVFDGVVKAWKRHKRMTQLFAVPAGEIKLVVYDDRDGSSTKNIVSEIITGVDRYALVKIPPMVWYGFAGHGSQGMIANLTNMPHDPAESEKRVPGTPLIPYTW